MLPSSRPVMTVVKIHAALEQARADPRKPSVATTRSVSCLELSVKTTMALVSSWLPLCHARLTRRSYQVIRGAWQEALAANKVVIRRLY